MTHLVASWASALDLVTVVNWALILSNWAGTWTSLPPTKPATRAVTAAYMAPHCLLTAAGSKWPSDTYLPAV